ncbi:MAG: nucleotidyl transferase AbiEii/AbiGii toxin family protein, partial [Bacteroidetes bacterium]|nr:nucleotidyl transferase AbiEii/AbiGii toxin family protein [Bacteroidota bacterium]
MSILTENQQRVLGVLSKVGLLKNNFYFGGGTALSEFYLQHRYSEDFDFHTSKEKIIPGTVQRIEAAFIKNKFQFNKERSSETFTRMFVKAGDENIILDLSLDAPSRLYPTVFNEEYKLFIENITDLCCNKLSALFDRSEPKDFVDIYFIDKEIMKLNKLIALTKKKHIGFEDYWLA